MSFCHHWFTWIPIDDLLDATPSLQQTLQLSVFYPALVDVFTPGDNDGVIVVVEMPRWLSRLNW